MKILSIAVLCLIVNICTSQSVTIKVEYEEIVTYIPQIINKSKSVLLASKNFSHYKTTFLIPEVKGVVSGNSIVLQDDENEDYCEVFVDFKTQKLVENIFESNILKSYFSVAEKIPLMNWKLVAGQKKINNFICNKALTTFRGRSYEVWYTEEIPVSAGPWKFSGLPGLILSVEDASGIFKWNAKNIKYPYNVNAEIQKNTKTSKKFENILFQELDAKIIAAYKDRASISSIRSSREGIKTHMMFSTRQWKEPVNEWRTETEIKQ